ncbi:putative transcription factor bHLH family [Helianthus annuus]|nr:putative transcription factor bHLH family [Helianthus annuus]
MLALSPSMFSTTHGWALDDFITQNLSHDCNEANSYNPVLDIHTYDQFKYDLAPELSISSGETTKYGGTGDEMIVVKKLNHNASERDRRKRVNELYAFLRSLLPIPSDQKVHVLFLLP